MDSSGQVKFYTTEEAAKRLGLSTARVQQFCRYYKVLKVGRDYILSEEDLYKIHGRIGKRGDKVK